MGIFGKGKKKTKAASLNYDGIHSSNVSSHNNNNNNNVVDEMIAVNQPKPNREHTQNKYPSFSKPRSWRLNPKTRETEKQHATGRKQQQQYTSAIDRELYDRQQQQQDYNTTEPSDSSMEEMSANPHEDYADYFMEDVPAKQQQQLPPVAKSKQLPPPAATATPVSYHQNGDKYYTDAAPSFYSSYNNSDNNKNNSDKSAELARILKKASIDSSDNNNTNNNNNAPNAANGATTKTQNSKSHSNSEHRSKKDKSKSKKSKKQPKTPKSPGGRKSSRKTSKHEQNNDHHHKVTPASTMPKSVTQQQQHELLAMQMQELNVLEQQQQQLMESSSSFHETPATAAPSMEELNEVTRDLVKAFIGEIWNRGEIHSIEKVCSPRLRFNSHNGMEKVGHEGFSSMVRAVRTSLEDYHCEIHSMVVEGRKCFCRLKFTGKHVGELMGYPATHKLVAWMGASEFTVCPKRNQILKVWELGDILSLEKQLKGGD